MKNKNILTSRTAEWQILLFGLLIIFVLVYLAMGTEDSVKIYQTAVNQTSSAFQALRSVAKISEYTHQIGHFEKMFVLTGKLKHRDPIVLAQKGLDDEVSYLRQYMLTNHFQIKPLITVEQALEKRLSTTEKIMNEREKGGRLHAIQILLKGGDQRLDAEIFSGIKALNKNIETAIQSLTIKQDISSTQSAGLSRWFFIISMGIVLLFIFAILFNLQKRKRMELQIQTATHFKTQFLANMSHEIRTPLNSILGLSDILSTAPIGVEHKKHVKTIHKASNNLLTLINDILDLSKVESGNMRFENIPYNIKEVVNDALQMIEPKAEQKKIKLRTHIAEGLPLHLNGDPHRIQQILLNLLSNAVKFTENGEVELSVAFNDNILRLVIKDQGIGISPDQIHLLFEDFHQANAAISRQYGGTGLGLSICRKLAILMGGNIEVKSTPGEGSIFTVYLPAKITTISNAQQASSIANQDRPIVSDYSNKIILIADDSEDNRNLLLLYLSEKKCHLLLAENGQEAIDLVKEKSPDLILMDMQMPFVDGYEATRLIREFEKQSERSLSTIIALTASAMIEDRENSQQAGCTDFLSKPILKNTLISLLDKYLLATALHENP